jgi:hypothetical protein
VIPGFDEFLAAVRETLAPVAHLTDEEVATADLPQPVRNLVLGLRASLRIYEATRDEP